MGCEADPATAQVTRKARSHTGVCAWECPFSLRRSAICDYLQEKRSVLVITVAGGAFAALLYLVPLVTDAVCIGGSAALWTAGARILYCFFFSPSIGILDSIAMNSMDNPKKNFGQCRLWGSVAWGLISFGVIGPLMDYGGHACFPLAGT